MRPVNKGTSPYVSIGSYGEALPHLKEKIGLYCSYCEFPIKHVPEVEHIVSKSKGGAVTAWENLLLGCKYCNARKLAQVDTDNVEDYLWPDQYNTALAFSYIKGVPKINYDELEQIDQKDEAIYKAKKLYELVDLGNVPKAGEKDRRARERNAAYEIARLSLENWGKLKSEELKSQILLTAQSTGFFSVWMEVFAGESEILRAFIAGFTGTEKEYFDESGKVKPILNKQIKETCGNEVKD